MDSAFLRGAAERARAVDELTGSLARLGASGVSSSELEAAGLVSRRHFMVRRDYEEEPFRWAVWRRCSRCGTDRMFRYRLHSTAVQGADDLARSGGHVFHAEHEEADRG